MALTIGQMASVSYPEVLALSKKPENQWEESAFLRAAEAQGMISRRDLGPTIEAPFDWQRNASTAILATDLQTGDLTTKTSVIGTASYVPAQVSAWVVWSKNDDAVNPEANQKVDFVKALLSNVMSSHDDILEVTLFTTSAAGGTELIGLDTMVTTDGLGTIGGVNASTDAFWRNKVDGYVNGDDMEAGMESLWNRCAKGSGSALQPTLIVSDGQELALFNSTQQGQQRYMDSQDLKVGFKTTAFKTAQYVFSQKAPAGKLYFLNKKSYTVVVSKEYFRHKSQTQEIQASNGFTFKLFSAMQAVTNNRSRLGVLVKA
jgi:hypothetical protein